MNSSFCDPNRIPRKERERLRKKQEILQAARKVINEKGITGATIMEIANLAEFAKGTLYTYFQNKDDIILSLIIEDTEEDIKRLSQQMKGNYNPIHVLKVHFRQFMQWIDDNKELFRFIRIEGHEGAQLTEEVGSTELWNNLWIIGRVRNEKLVEVIKKAQDQNLISPEYDPKIALYALLAASYTFNLASGMGELDLIKDVGQRTDIILKIFFEGLQPK
jgi:AcrR family transcriptional regulator